MRVGVLTGGGDCPGLNAVIRAVVRRGIQEYGLEFVGFRDGWRLLRRKLARGDDGENRGSRPFGAVIQDAAKYAGLLLGKNEQFLPLSIKRRISGARFFG